MAENIKELCLLAAEAMVDDSVAQSRLSRIALQAEKFEIEYASAPGDEAKEAVLVGLRKLTGDEKPKRGRPAKTE